ncbi:MAG: HAD family hydrolase [Erysipelotrichaceae bacterium]|nr:HAD family hydrolase [Erysipelotrichaceae bacterium]
MKKVIFLDIDGTIVNGSNVMLPSTELAIKRAMAKGNEVFICTGRAKGEVNPFLLQLGFNGYICGNGCYIEADGKVIYNKVFEKEDLENIFRFLDERNVKYFVECEDCLVAREDIREYGNIAAQRFLRAVGNPHADERSFTDLFPSVRFAEDLHRDDVNKVSYLVNDEHLHEECEKAFPQFNNSLWGQDIFGEIGVSKVNKGDAVRMVLDYLGVEREDSYGFGDLDPDIPMLQACGTGIAMGNASERMKQTAHYITTEVDNDGIWNAFVHFELM